MSPSASFMDQRIHATFIGTVQGVGFRYSVQRAADQLGVCGWVKNLRNGNVEIIAEAPKEVLAQFLEQVKMRFSSYIRTVDVTWEPAGGEFKDFTITF
jgi:acylphosphatase